MVANFRPDEVPILSHHGGDWIGDLDELIADGPDLRFRGFLEPFADLLEQLRRARSLPVSIEANEGVDALPAGLRYPDEEAAARRSSAPTHWRGQVRRGWYLTGVAIEARPAAPGSLIWIERW
jgi:hypothetical protein